MSEQLLTAINDTFDPWRPLPAGDPLYVDCENVRGDANIIRSLGNSITRSTRDKCHLYAGHRGNGKSTELLRLKQHLEDNGCFVVYFDAGPSMNTIDIEYTDILLSCTEHLTLAIRDAYSQPILDWLKARWNSIKDFLDTEVEIESLKIEQQIEQIGKVTSSLKFNPSYRAQIREKIEPHTISLRDALNEFIRDAKKKLPDDKQKLIVIVDNLDRIVPVQKGDGKTNHDEIFIDRAAQLRSLECNIIYTVPISLVHSSRIIEMANVYDAGSTQILPMISVRKRNGNTNPEGLAQMRAILQERMKKCAPKLQLVPDIFETQELVDELCSKTGGYVRSLMLAVQYLSTEIDALPINERALLLCFSRQRNERRIAVDDHWDTLALIAMTKEIKNDDASRQLLFNRCILQYADVNDMGEVQEWYNIDPLIVGIPQFQEAMRKLSNPSQV
jgi:Cdc6-like AAA superfamily ATPase